MNDITKKSPDKLSIVVFSGDFEKVHYALVMASAAAATDRAVTLFFTMDGINALTKTTDGSHGWQAMETASGQPGAVVDQGFGDNGVGQFEDLLSACQSLGVVFMVCEMGLRAKGITRSALRHDLEIKEGGVVTFLNDASQTGQIIFI